MVISGTISGSDNGDKGHRLSFQDATGEIQVVPSEKVLTALHIGQLVPGLALTITGPVKLLDGKLAIPESASAVTLTP